MDCKLLTALGCLNFTDFHALELLHHEVTNMQLLIASFCFGFKESPGVVSVLILGYILYTCGIRGAKEMVVLWGNYPKRLMFMGLVLGAHFQTFSCLLSDPMEMQYSLSDMILYKNGFICS